MHAPEPFLPPQHKSTDARQDKAIKRSLIIYQLEAGHYGRPAILELKGQTALTAIPGVTIDWDRVLARMS
jgi:hypothetical protein